MIGKLNRARKWLAGTMASCLKGAFGVVAVLSLLGGSVVITCMLGWLFIHKGILAGIVGSVLFPLTALVFPLYLWHESGRLWPLLFYVLALIGMGAIVADDFAEKRSLQAGRGQDDGE